MNTNTSNNLNFDAFSHGQIMSKLWLCDKLKFVLPVASEIKILGSWYNLLGFLLATKLPEKVKSIIGLDLDPDAVAIANYICNAWQEGGKITNVLADANDYIYKPTDVIINCSPEHMVGDAWFRNIPIGTLMCVQSSNMNTLGAPWFITSPNTSLRSFKEKFKLSTTFYCDAQSFNYPDLKYDRYMIIGIK